MANSDKSYLFKIFFLGLIGWIVGAFVFVSLKWSTSKQSNVEVNNNQISQSRIWNIKNESVVKTVGTGDVDSKNNVEIRPSQAQEEANDYENTFFAKYCDDPNDFDCRLDIMDKLALSGNLDKESCDNFVDIATKNNCYYMLARQLWEPQICEKIDSDEVLYNICLDQVQVFLADNPASLEACMNISDEQLGNCLFSFYNSKQFQLAFDDCRKLESLIKKYNKDPNLALSCWDNAIRYNAYLKNLNLCDIIDSKFFPNDKLSKKCKLEYWLQNWCDKLGGELKTQCQLLEAQRLLDNQF